MISTLRNTIEKSFNSLKIFSLEKVFQGQNNSSYTFDLHFFAENSIDLIEIIRDSDFNSPTRTRHQQLTFVQTQTADRDK